MKKIIISETQEQNLIKALNEDTYQMPVDKKMNKPYCINPEKVKIVKKFLDKGFKKGFFTKIGSNGLPKKIKIVGMMADDGTVLKNMYLEQLHDLLIDNFQNMFSDHNERSLFMNQVMNDWFDNKISLEGLLSRNSLSENITSEEVDERANETNIHPTDAQKEAGNYKMGHFSIEGMPISIENPIGSERKYKNDDNTEGRVTIKNHYGYFKGTTGNGKDGDAVDVFIGPNVESFNAVYVVDQYINGEFDESKVMLGFSSKEQAKEAYFNNYNEDWKGLKYITGVPTKVFKKWLYRGNKQRKPFAEYVDIQKKKINESILNEEEYNEIRPIIKVLDSQISEKIIDMINQSGVYAYSKNGIIYAQIERDRYDDSYVDYVVDRLKEMAKDYCRSKNNLAESFDNISLKDMYNNIKSNPSPDISQKEQSYNGWKIVRKPNGKMNLQNEETGEFLSDKWYDFVGYLINGFAIVSNGGVYNIMNEHGDIVLPYWHDDVIDYNNDGNTYLLVDGEKQELVTRNELIK